MQWVGHVVGEENYRVLVRKSEGMRPLRSPRHREESSMKMDIK
jgi:hypothetical protein